MSVTSPTVLDPHVRGDEFSYSFVLGNGWTSADFTGGLVFTLRKRWPPSSVTDDTDAGVLAQGSVAGGQITFSSPTAGTVLFPNSETQDWPNGKIYGDIQGKVTIGARVFTLDRVALVVLGDATRS